MLAADASTRRSRSCQDTFGAGVDVHRVSTQESDEPHARAFGELDGETRGGGYGREQWNLGHECFLHDLEARSSADHEDASFEREAIREQRCPDDLVDGVVSAYVLTQVDQVPFAIEEPGRVDASRLVETLLSGAHPLREGAQERRFHSEGVVRHGGRLESDRFDREFAA